MTPEFNVIIEKDEDGYYVASVPALRGCHTQAKSLDVLMKRVREAIDTKDSLPADWSRSSRSMCSVSLQPNRRVCAWC